MSTLNLSPKNPLVVLALAGGAMWLLTRRPATAQVRPVGGASTINTTNTIAAVSNAISGIASIFRPAPTSYGVPDEAARAAVRAGDPYYGGYYAGDGTLNGLTPGWSEQWMADATAYANYVGTADDATGDPYNPGY